MSATGIDPASLRAVTKIVADVANVGGRLYYNRDSSVLFADAYQQLPFRLVLRIETHKKAVLYAIAGKLGLIDADDSIDAGDGGTGDGGTGGLGLSDSVLQMLIDILQKQGDEILPSDEVTTATLNKHKYAFDPKFDALAATFEALKVGEGADSA